MTTTARRSGGRAMRLAAGRPVALLVVVLSLAGMGLGGCGGGSDSGGGDGGRTQAIAAGRAYAARVSAITQRTSAELAKVARTSSYETAAAASSSTRAYATAIRAAAGQLAAAGPTALVRTQHEALVTLYRATADRMDALAQRFAAAGDIGALATQAQAFSAEVQRYSTRELQLRTAIEQALAAQVSPPVLGTTQPAVQPTSDDPG